LQIDTQLAANLISLYRPEWVLASLPVDPEEYESPGAAGFWRRRRLDSTPLHRDLALLLSTSGSTGSPKFVRLRRGNVEANAESIRQALAISDQDVPVAHLPVHYSYGLSVVNSHLLAGSTAAEPFHESVVDASVDLSQRIFHDPEARAYPELLALAYWMRKAEMNRLTAQFRSLQLDHRVLAPRGLVFHLPPRNVDTIFVYSWLLAALTGNRSVVRLSPQRSESTSILLRLLRETLAAAAEPARGGTTIVSYGHEEEPTEMLSALCDARVIWGGDQTVEIIRRSPLAPHAKEITFPDRYSLSAIRADVYAGLPEEKRDYLADQFFNDSYWFDQLACSSPRLVVWCGTGPETRAAAADFFRRVAGCVERRRYVLPAAASMQKLVYACSSILNSTVEECRRYKGLIVWTLWPVSSGVIPVADCSSRRISKVFWS